MPDGPLADARRCGLLDASELLPDDPDDEPDDAQADRVRQRGQDARPTFAIGARRTVPISPTVRGSLGQPSPSVDRHRPSIRWRVDALRLDADHASET